MLQFANQAMKNYSNSWLSLRITLYSLCLKKSKIKVGRSPSLREGFRMGVSTDKLESKMFRKKTEDSKTKTKSQKPKA